MSKLILSFCFGVIIINLLIQKAEAECNINIFVENTENYALEVANFSDSTGVKTKGGVWRSLRKGLWFLNTEYVPVDANEKRGDAYRASFGCKSERRYRFSYQCLGGSQNGAWFTEYYPSATGWTDKQTFTIRLSFCK